MYSTLQKHALIHNVFITPINKITIWDLTPGSVPPTCNLDTKNNINFHQAYQGMAATIFTKLSKVKFAKVPFFSTMVDNEKPSQDEYKVLYAFLTCCHPKLVQHTKLDAPQMVDNGNLFNFMRKYKNWLKYKKISKRYYTELENLSVVVGVLESDGRFSKALNTIYMLKQQYEQMLNLHPTTQFPQQLTINNIPYTIMNEYLTSNKNELFGMNNNNNKDITTPTINRITTPQNPYRRQANNNQ